MFCEKCGSQIPDDAKFCENCGNPTGSIAPVVSAAKAPSAFALALKKFFSKKSNLIISIVALVLIIAAIVTVIVISSQPKKFYLDDCIEFTFYGANGYGSIDINVDQEKLEAFEKKLFTKPELVGKLGYLVDIEFDCDLGSLKNGDKVTVSLEFTEEAEVLELDKFMNGILTLKNKVITVKGLSDPTLFDIGTLVQQFNIFSGYNGYGSMVEDVTLYEGAYNGGTVTITSGYNYIRVYFDLPNSSEVIYYYADNTSNLSNGDVVTFSHNVSEDTKEYLLSMGVVLTDANLEVTVNGLTDLINFDVASCLTPVFNGYNGYGIFNSLIADGTTFDCGNDYTVTFNYDSGSSRFTLTVTNKNDTSDSYSTTYYCDSYDDLTNGDKLSFYTYYADSIERYYGVVIPETFELEVSGLTDAIDPQIFANAIYDITGFNGYGTLSFDIPEDKRIYTIGDYTFKITPAYKSSYYDVTVVVSDKDGKNILSVCYKTYDDDYLDNGDTIVFDCTTWNSTLEGYLSTYGINFPSSYTMTVSGLPEVTETNPLSYVKFSFTGTNGEIKIGATLTQSSYTVGNYTVSLTVTEGTSWWTNYLYINFVVTDSTGAECASGSYYTTNDGYYEGDTAYVRADFTTGDITKSLGLVFNTTTESLIVSTQ